MALGGKDELGSIQPRGVIDEASKNGENGFSFAGFAQIRDASEPFGLFTAAGIVKRRNDNHRNC